MRRLVGLDALSPAAFRNPAVTIGVFDGMHRGHRHLIERLRALADRRDGEAVVVTFETHPLAVIKGEAPRRILSTEHRLRLLEKAEVDATVLLPFDETIRRMPYERFAEEILVKRIGVKTLLFGWNANFGFEGRGTARTLAPLGRRFGFDVVEAPPVSLHGTPISSSRIREAIQAGDLDAAAEMLGRPVAISGPVVKGDGRGRQLGFPTANVDAEGEILPPRGVYQVVAEIRGQRRAAVANVGVRPTFAASGGQTERPVLEVHVPGVDFDFYGERIEVELVRKLRDERVFASKEALVRQIRDDVASLGSAT